MSRPAEQHVEGDQQLRANSPIGRTSRLRQGMARLLQSGGDLLFPPVCAVCRTPLMAHDALCAACWQQIDFIRPPLCDRLGWPMPFDTGGVMISAAAAAAPPAYGRARAVARYDGAFRMLIHDLKFHDQHHARRLLARWMAESGRDLLSDAEILVPVPLSRMRLLWRRFNQSAELASALSRQAGVPSSPLALVRIRRTKPQPGLSAREREENVRGAFAVRKRRMDEVKGRNVVLIDDVITTGATANACARALKAAGARRVDVLALALVTDRALVVR